MVGPMLLSAMASRCLTSRTAALGSLIPLLTLSQTAFLSVKKPGWQGVNAELFVLSPQASAHTEAAWAGRQGSASRQLSRPAAAACCAGNASTARLRSSAMRSRSSPSLKVRGPAAQATCAELERRSTPARSHKAVLHWCADELEEAQGSREAVAADARHDYFVRGIAVEEGPLALYKENRLSGRYRRVRSIGLSCRP